MYMVYIYVVSKYQKRVLMLTLTLLNGVFVVLFWEMSNAVFSETFVDLEIIITFMHILPHILGCKEQRFKIKSSITISVICGFYFAFLWLLVVKKNLLLLVPSKGCCFLCIRKKITNAELYKKAALNASLFVSIKTFKKPQRSSQSNFLVQFSVGIFFTFIFTLQTLTFCLMFRFKCTFFHLSAVQRTLNNEIFFFFFKF